jgi:hypothetical protein
MLAAAWHHFAAVGVDWQDCLQMSKICRQITVSSTTCADWAPVLDLLQANQATEQAQQQHQGLEAELHRLAGLVADFQEQVLQVRIGHRSK